MTNSKNTCPTKKMLPPLRSNTRCSPCLHCSRSPLSWAVILNDREHRKAMTCSYGSNSRTRWGISHVESHNTLTIGHSFRSFEMRTTRTKSKTPTVKHTLRAVPLQHCHHLVFWHLHCSSRVYEEYIMTQVFRARLTHLESEYQVEISWIWVANGSYISINVLRFYLRRSRSPW